MALPLTLSGVSSPFAAERVSLQLRWDHQFQFAGYDAAQWQGYYDEAGLDVEIRSGVLPGGRILRAVDEVADNRADFGIGAADILVARDRGLPLVLLAPVFQQSPVGGIVRKDAGLSSPADLVTGPFDADGFISDRDRARRIRTAVMEKYLFGGFILGLAGAVAFFVWTGMLRRTVAERTRRLRESEALFRAVVENSPTKIHIKDVEGRYTLINPEAEKLFGVTDEEGRGKTSHDLFPRKVADAFMAHDREVVELGRTIEKEEEFMLDDGIHTFLTVKFPIYNMDGVVAVAAIGTDITERKRIEQELSESQARFKDFADATSDWFWEMDADLRFTYFSERNQQVTGGKLNAFLGKTRREATNENMNDEHWRRHFDDLDAHRPFRDFRYDLATLEGRMLHITISGKPVFDADGTFKGYRGSGTDITEQMRAEQELYEAKEVAVSANRAKTDFLANMSHELRTPLNAVIGFADMMQMEIFGPLGSAQYRGYVSDIRGSGRHLLQVIDDILDVSKIEAGEIKIEEENVEVGAVIESCLRMIRERAEKSRVAVSTDIAGHLPMLVLDKRHLKQILLNLLSNAVKFTPAGGRVGVTARLGGDAVIALSVTDTGVGIAEEDLERVLEPFAQARDIHVRSHEGTGLGLYLAKSLTELYGGTLTLESKVGKGTTVTVIFPPERIAAVCA